MKERSKRYSKERKQAVLSKRSQPRTIATRGRVDPIAGELDSVISGLMRVSGRAELDEDGPIIEFDPSRPFGDVWALNELWKQLDFDALRARRSRIS